MDQVTMPLSGGMISLDICYSVGNVAST